MRLYGKNYGFLASLSPCLPAGRRISYLPCMKTFQQQFEELENIVRTFESGDVDLDVGLKEFEKGMKLAGELKKKLDGAEVKLETLKKEYIKS